MIDNFDLIKPLLQFDSEDDFYFVQIIKRKKEHRELGSNSMIIKTYYVKSVEHLITLMPEIISLCTFHNARGCINLNRRSFEKCAFNLLKKVSDIIMNRDYKSCRQAYDSVCGSHASEINRKWIIDVDRQYDELQVGWISDKLKEIDPNPGHDKVIKVLPTKNGYHLITTPFDMRQVRDFMFDDVHKDNPTILFIPD